ncbi:2-oxo acid dehydrogenase subunit E2 [Paenibacillus psychroresistens]|uniref:Dihydrolipoamide acetyltransferase component of pyruvate dehydrogenase complex n=1 Tax=Paenibacillus psychroresistens TaxID=1778678 RepID=A0A6B8REF0_9BACL|nr:dihydrolipoamide acetyltransferase family protein [Paenibacillus psychroresistens]QGQ94297.1 2-oxo acid dehydrogenase subunit E2 [Paenibacillus psychroresistens]
MQESIRLPKMELSMEEGRIQKWLVTAGIFIKKGEIIAEIETDKAVVELEMPQDGSILSFIAKEGELVPVGSAIAELASNSAISSEVNAASSNAQTEKAATPIITAALSERIAISPAARRRARELGVDYTKLKGTGPRGRIVFRDLELAGQAVMAAVQPETELKSNLPIAGGQPLSKMRRTIAKRLLESVNTIPQFSIKKSVDVSKALEIKQVIQGSLAKSGIKLTFTDFLISAVAQALNKHRSLNASFIGSPYDADCFIVEHPDVNIGLAVSTDAGLVVPVLHKPDELSIASIARLRMSKIDSVRKQSLKAEDLQGGTFTISNLGMLDVDEFQAIINPPEAGILAVGSIRQAPVLIDGKLEFRPTLILTGTFDHRVVDGAAAARFMQTLSEQLQSDEWILV